MLPTFLFTTIKQARGNGVSHDYSFEHLFQWRDAFRSYNWYDAFNESELVLKNLNTLLALAK